MPALIARWLFASRWLLTLFHVALIVALVGLLGKVAERAYELVIKYTAYDQDDVILAALGIVDLTLTASLVVLVIFSGFANFVERVESDDKNKWPRWMTRIDFVELKLRLMGSIVAISGIKLLEAYMNLDHESDRDLAWQAGIFGVFVVAALLLALADRLGDGGGGSKAGQ